MLLLLFTLFILSNCQFHTNHEDSEIILTAHGMSIDDMENRVVIPIHDGHIPPLPCVMMNAGTHEHGQTFTHNNFHYQCNNGTAEVVACVSDDQSVIQMGRTFVKNGIRHKCLMNGDQVTYEQESMCFENGVHYNMGDSFRNGSFKLTCKKEGISIEGCYLQDSMYDIIVPGESRIVGRQKHSCEIISAGKIRYTVKVIGCNRGTEVMNIGQIWTDKHVRYRCQEDGTLLVLGCVDDGLFIDLGRDLLINEMVHRCYQVDSTTFYHKFMCEGGRSLHDCVSSHINMRARRFSKA